MVALKLPGNNRLSSCLSFFSSQMSIKRKGEKGYVYNDGGERIVSQNAKWSILDPDEKKKQNHNEGNLWFAHDFFFFMLQSFK